MIRLYKRLSSSASTTNPLVIGPDGRLAVQGATLEPVSARNNTEPQATTTTTSSSHPPPGNPPPPHAQPLPKRLLTEPEAYPHLAFSLPTRQKWLILTSIFLVQLSMNFNASVYANAIPLLSSHFHITPQRAGLGQLLFLITYAFGCELWAPWSEEWGRKGVLQASLGLVNLWALVAATARGFETVLVARVLGGLCSAGGSVTLGMVADLWEVEGQQFGVGFVVLASVGGSVVGPIAGGFMQEGLGWRWNFWIQLVLGVGVQVVHAVVVPETRSSVLVDREARRRREAGERDIYGPSEFKEGLTVKEVLRIWARPFVMFATEPIVLFLSLLSGFSDALIFTFLMSWGPVFAQWGWGPIQIGLAFFALLVGYLISYALYLPDFLRQRRNVRRDPANAKPEDRLWLLMFLAPLLPLGLFGFAWTSLGPAHGIPWIAPLLFAALIGIANLAVYMATVDYMIAAYGPYSSSATGGNGFARDLLAGISAIYALPLYRSLGDEYQLEWASTLLGGIAVLVVVPVYLFYWKGEEIRGRSRFACEIEVGRRERAGEMRRGGDAEGGMVEGGRVEMAERERSA